MRGVHLLCLTDEGPDDKRVPDLGHDLQVSRYRDLYDSLERDKAPLGVVGLTLEEFSWAVKHVPDGPL